MGHQASYLITWLPVHSHGTVDRLVDFRSGKVKSECHLPCQEVLKKVNVQPWLLVTGSQICDQPQHKQLNICWLFRLRSDRKPSAWQLQSHLKEAMLPFLRSCALLYHYISAIKPSDILQCE